MIGVTLTGPICHPWDLWWIDKEQKHKHKRLKMNSCRLEATFSVERYAALRHDITGSGSVVVSGEPTPASQYSVFYKRNAPASKQLGERGTSREGRRGKSQFRAHRWRPEGPKEQDPPGLWFLVQTLVQYSLESQRNVKRLYYWATAVFSQCEEFCVTNQFR